MAIWIAFTKGLHVILALLLAQSLPFPGPGAAQAGCGTPVTGMQYWAASDNGPSCSGTCTNGATITSLTDLSGNSHTGTPYGSPTFVTSALNGLPVIRCGSGHCGFTISPTISEPAAHTWTVFAVGKAATSVNSSFTGCALDACFTYYLSGPNGHQQAMQSPNVAFGPSGTASPDTSYHQLNVQYNTSTGAYTYRRDRAADGSGTQTISVTVALDQMLGSSQSRFNIDQNKDTAEVIVYNTILSGGDVTANEAYLNCRYGL